jgi:hypothetical protein
MKIPQAERAVIEPAKIRHYLLSTSHPVGRFKAPFFASLGYTSAKWRLLANDPRDLAVSRPYGQKYEICGTLNGPAGRSARVRTVWIILFGGDVPHFVTALPGE